MSDLAALRSAIRASHLEDEGAVLVRLMAEAKITEDLRAAATTRAARLVTAIRAEDRGGLMEVFLAEYGLSTAEGLALMRLAEALLRVPDAETVDALIEDKIVPAEWAAHRGKSRSGLVNASTLALMLTGKVLSDEDGEGIAGALRGAVKRLGEPVIRSATRRAMKEMGNQFVLGETIQDAVERGRKRQAQGFTYSYDMLGEAALTAGEATAFHAAYAKAIAHLAKGARGSDIRDNPGISVKLSALHSRYEFAKHARVMAELVPQTLVLCEAAKAAGMGLNIDAEEADRLDLSLDVIEAVLRSPTLEGWDGFGVVVQAYGKRAGPVIDWLHALADRLDRKIMVRLVKGAYWDTEIKRAQVEGMDGFPVFTRKSATDVSYLCCAAKLLAMTDRIYPQFATHNAHTVAAILEMASDFSAFEFQRLHGMGEALHDQVHAGNATRCRIYAPVGAHRDLLAYLVRRLLENGANSSFVHQLMDEDVPAAEVARDPFAEAGVGTPNEAVTAPSDLFAPARANSKGVDLRAPLVVESLDVARAAFRSTQWTAGQGGQGEPVTNPADPADIVGHVHLASADDARAAIARATPWQAPASERAAILTRAADLYEVHTPELFAILTREAGKTLPDCVAELREAVDFLRYYATEALRHDAPPRGRFTCISPWNFPLAIFTGQIAAALAAGNAVLAKPAEATPLIAARATALLHEAGVPDTALQLVPGHGSVVGAVLTSDPRIDGVAFTGSTATAQAIHRAMAENLAPDAPLIAETGGINAMIVDSTALPEQAVKDVIASAFQSAGQRCSALRLLFIQEDIAPAFLKALLGTMDQQSLADPWARDTDIGPVIDARAKAGITAHIDAARKEGRVLKEVAAPEHGIFVGPTVIRVSGMADLKQEIFGPVLHVATFKARALDSIVAEINASGYGLTFGLHSRIDERIADLAERVEAGNLYINRNQIGAIVGSQPFGGHGLSGTGPKAGGPDYLARFLRADQGQARTATGRVARVADVERALAALNPSETALSTTDLPGPTGETNRLSLLPRGRILCLGPGRDAAEAQAAAAREMGCATLTVTPGGEIDGILPAEALETLALLDGVIFWGPAEEARALRQALAARPGAILPLITEADPRPRCVLERHLCVDTTAAGGNAGLLASVA